MGMLLHHCVYGPVLGVLLVLFLGIVHVRGEKEQGDVESARCRVRCLAHLKHVSKELLNKASSFLLIAPSFSHPKRAY